MTQQKCRTLLRRPLRGRKWSHNLPRKHTRNRKTANASNLLVRTPTIAILLAVVLFNAPGDNLCSSIVRPDLFFIQTLAFAFGITNTIVFTNGNHLQIFKTTSKNQDDELIQFHGKSLYASNSITFSFISIHALYLIYPINRNTVVLLRVHQTNKPPITFGFNQEYIRYWFSPLRTKAKEAFYAVSFTGSRPVVGRTPRECTLKKRVLTLFFFHEMQYKQYRYSYVLGNGLLQHILRTFLNYLILWFPNLEDIVEAKAVPLKVLKQITFFLWRTYYEKL